MPVLYDTIGGPFTNWLCLECRLNDYDDPQYRWRHCVMNMTTRIHLPGPAWRRLPHLRDEQANALQRVYLSMTLTEDAYKHMPALESVDLVERIYINGAATPWFRICAGALERVDAFFRWRVGCP